ncbi:NAD(P)-dependent alcohol dehydrogenase [Streptomyces aurantiogriseus]|uniref:alcohol dehydrogenase (NADP(+)) n=1 Tax=Streptomyces aurantiogriseus TaxID=66870 RepID=A0A918C2N9_9ACTN|nr:NAD(P)-dependent alcohol dehydrogenase [Streptomyces aurantiogriseus]GGR02696.1 dehydrogenase [Streptomyces aurantiogriseus]
MPLTVPAWAAPAPGAPLEPTAITRRDIGERDVLIEIAHTGICHTDLHQVRADWGPGIFPMVPGHEITGTVTAAGPGVQRYALGDRVGVGCLVDSCRECSACRAGDEQYCARGHTATYNSRDRYGEPTQGGYSTHIVVDERYVVRIPDALELDRAAPLLCAGVTVHAPLVRRGAGAGTRVAVLGLGGLGHLAVQLAHAMGAEVTVLSRSPHKRDDALRLGAKAFATTSDPSVLGDLAGSFDLLLNTVSAGVDLDACLRLLAVDGTFVGLGVPDGPSAFGFFSLMLGRRSIEGSLFGSVAETQRTLDFCARTGVAAEIETVTADRINEAFDRLARGDVRYRFVIDAGSFSA